MATARAASSSGSASAASTFAELGLGRWLVDVAGSLGLRVATPIQQACIPAILRGDDVIGASHTGTGKTAAFALPMIDVLSRDPFGIFALVLTPTRELACQIGEQFSAFGKALGIKVAVVTGGADMMHQALQLGRKPHVVVATPGRLIDHLNSSSAPSFQRIRFLVLDEADQLLQGYFLKELAQILPRLPPNRQNLFFSATVGSALEVIQTMAQRKPVLCDTTKRAMDTAATVDQRFVVAPSHVKEAHLIHVLQSLPSKLCIVFVARRRTCQLLYEMARELDVSCTVLHSVQSQQERLAAISLFKSRQVNVLFCTDVASRGLDIPLVDVVLNYDLPANPKDYVHRIGRTGRAGATGTAISLVTQFDVDLVRAIEKATAATMTAFPVKDDDVLKILNKVAKSKRVATIELSESGFEERLKAKREQEERARALIDGTDGDGGGDGAAEDDGPSSEDDGDITRAKGAAVRTGGDGDASQVAGRLSRNKRKKLHRQVQEQKVQAPAPAPALAAQHRDSADVQRASREPRGVAERHRRATDKQARRGAAADAPASSSKRVSAARGSKR